MSELDRTNSALKSLTWQTLLQRLSDYVIIIDSEGTIVFVNHLMPGWEFDQVLGSKIFDWLPQSSHLRIKESLESVFSGDGKSLQEVIELPFGVKTHSWLVRFNPIVSEDVVREAVIVATDVTDSNLVLNKLEGDRDQLEPEVQHHSASLIEGHEELRREIEERVRIEATLRESEEKFRALAEQSPHGIVISQGERFIFVNDSVSEILETPLETIMSRPIIETFPQFVHPEFRALIEKRYQHRIEGSDVPARYEMRVITAKGNERWIEVSSKTISYGGQPANQTLVTDVTERKHWEVALSESEERYRTLVENAPSAIFSMNRDGVFSFMNSVAAKRLGGRPEEFIGRNMKEFFPDNIASRQMSSVQRVIDSGESETIKNLTDVNGQPCWYVTSITPLRSANGDSKLAFLIGTDITETVLLGEKLKRERDFITSILQTANSLIFCLDGDARITVFNDECERVTGYQAEEVLGKRWPDIFMPEEFRHDELKDFASWVKAHPSDRREEPILTKSGESRLILWSNSSLVSPETGELAAIAVGYDITEMKKASLQLKEAESKYRSLVEHLPAITYTASLDPASTTLYVSPQVESLLGFSPEHYVANPDLWRQRLHPEDETRVLAEVSRIHATGEPLLIEYRLRHRDGHWVWFRDHATVVKDNTGQTLLLQGVMYDVTPLKEAEQQLQFNEKRYRLLVENVGAAIALIARSGEFLFVNRIGVNHFGSSAEEIIGKTIQQLLPPNRAKGYMERIQSVIDAGCELLGEDEADVNGRHYWFDFGMYPYRDASQQITATLVIAQDMTDRRKAETALRERNQLIENVAQVTPDIIHIYDVSEGREVYSNRSVHEVLGYREVDIANHGENAREFLVHPDDRNKRAEKMELITKARDGEVVETAQRLKHADGSYRWFLERAVVFQRADDGSPKQVLGLIQDVTERRQSQEKVFESEERFRELADLLPQTVFELDKEGHFRFVNSFALKTFGYSNEDLIGEVAAMQMIAPEDRERAWSNLTSDMGAKRAFGNEYLAQTKDGTRFPVIIYSTPIIRDGQVQGYRGIVVDITQRKRSEEALRMSEERFRTLFKSSPIPAYTWKWQDNDLVLVAFNDAAENITEGGIADYIGTSVGVLYRNRPEVQKELLQCLQEKRTFRKEMLYDYVSTDKRLYVIVNYAYVPPDIVLVHTEDITERRLMEEALRIANEQLESERLSLHEKNIALRVVLDKIQEEVSTVKLQMQTNVDRLVMPAVLKLKESAREDDLIQLNLIESLLTDVFSPFARSLEERYSRLTPREIEVCNMIKSGLQSKEIAKALSISPRTVEKFRNRIRQKLHIDKKDTNLATFLRKL